MGGEIPRAAAPCRRIAVPDAGLPSPRHSWRRAPRDGIRRALRRQHRRQGSAGAGGAAPGVRRWFWGPPVGAPAHWGRAGGVDQWRCGMNLVAHGGTWAVLASCGTGGGVRNRYDRFCVDSAGRPRASPEPTVLLGDRAAVPCRPVTTLERGPTTHGTIRTSHRSSEATRGSFGPAPG